MPITLTPYVKLATEPISAADAFDLEAIDLADLTCAQCPHSAGCEFAFDLYNTDGDCLAMK